jgi:hypothetical protein
MDICNVYNLDQKYIVVSRSIGFEKSRVDIAGAITLDSLIYLFTLTKSMIINIQRISVF